MKTISIIFMLALLSPEATANSTSVSLPTMVCNADAIIFGKLSKYEARQISIRHEKAKPPYSVYYDSAQIVDVRVLKSRTKLSGPQPILFLSKEQTFKSFYSAPNFSEGNAGVWFLYNDHLTNSFLVGRPSPMADESLILKLIAETVCEN